MLCCNNKARHAWIQRCWFLCPL